MKLYIKTTNGWDQVDCQSAKFRFETEDGIFTVTERMDLDTLRTQISVEETLFVLPHAANAVQIREGVA
jgi:hypothetical protein